VSRISLGIIAKWEGWGGVYVDDSLTDLLKASGTITLDLNRLDGTQYKELTTTIRQGFRTKDTGVTKSLLALLNQTNYAADVPNCPAIGYMGKKALDVLVLKDKAVEYRKVLISAAHMVDVDLSDAVGVENSDWADLRWLKVNAARVRQQGAKKHYDTRAGRRAGQNLAPATSKLTNLVRTWSAEIIHLRQPMLEWLATRPVITYRIMPKDAG
jgi:hypothetical protein